jgi:anaphase-promoting complex subunit 3
MSLLKKLSDGYYNLSLYNCAEAIEEFKKLPSNHLNTGWVLSSIGRSYMELVKYSDAASYYEQAYRLEPYRTEGV